MYCSLTVNHEYNSLSCGRIRTNLWVSSYEGVEDGGIFLMQDNTGMVDTHPEYVSTCNPCNLVEYPFEEPEGPRGLFRTTSASWIHNSRKEAEASVAVVMNRIIALRQYMEVILDPDANILREVMVNTTPVLIEHTRRPQPFSRLKISLPADANYIRYRISGTPIGVLCEGYCDPVDMTLLGTVPMTAAGWRANTLDFTVYTSLRDAVIDRMLEGLSVVAL